MKRAKYTTGYEAVFRLVEGFLDLLERKGMKRADLARALEVPRSSITKWFAGRNMTVFTAAMIAEALGAELRFEFVHKDGASTKPDATGVIPQACPDYRAVTPLHFRSTPSKEAAVPTAAVSLPRTYSTVRDFESAAESVPALERLVSA